MPRDHIPTPPPFASQIRAELQARGWSQRELGRRLGWSSAGRVSEILSGRRELTLAMVRDLCVVLELSADALVFAGAEPRPASAPKRTTPNRTTPKRRSVRREVGRHEFDWM